jgi:hypothetical protein
MSERCHYCGGKFGLVRWTRFRIGQIIQYRSKQCEREHDRELQAQCDASRSRYWITTTK